MNVRLVKEFRFEAAHQLPRVPPGHKCARMHGHSFRVEISVHGPVDPETGWFLDYEVVDRAFAPLHDALDHRTLNEIPGLENPTSEHLARWLWDRLRPALPALERVVVWETADARCEYEGH